MRPPVNTAEPSRRRKFLFYAITLSLPFAVFLLSVFGYYAYKKVTENVVYSESFGQLDSEIGWVLQPQRESRVYLQNRATGETYYDVWIRTNVDGFRSNSTDDPSPVGGIVAIGDSWTFGTAVEYEDSYPAQLAHRVGTPVVNMGVPAYGLAQTILLLERHVARLQPRIVVHVNLGLWIRSVCYGETIPQKILKPCFWHDPAAGAMRLVLPPSGYVERMAAAGVYPGGWLTAGHNSWSYYLISRPAVRVMQLLSRLGIMDGPSAEDSPEAPHREAILAYALERLLQLAQQHGFMLILLDPAGQYAQAVAAVKDLSRYLEYVGADETRTKIQPLIGQVPEERWRVKGDGHYTGEYMNAWVTELAPRTVRILRGGSKAESAP